MLRLATALALVLLQPACASNLQITYYSDPPGAVLYQDGQPIGYAPRTLHYQPPGEQQHGRGRVRGIKAVWASGATAEIPFLNVDVNAHGLNQQFTFLRPDVPGRDADMRFAVELERNQIMRAQAQAQQDQTFWQMYNAYQQQNRVRTPTNCSSTVWGNTINTTCY